MPAALRTPVSVAMVAGVLAALGHFLLPGERDLLFAMAMIVLGLGLLISGADWLVRGAVRLARIFGVSPFFIALTVVAFGTSAPELAASIGATLKQEGEIAIGNVLGSNIANLCLILGLTAVVRTVPVASSVLRVDMPIVVIVSILGSITLLDGFFVREGGQAAAGSVSQLDGLLLTLGLVAYVAYNAYTGKVDPAEIEEETHIDIRSAEPKPSAATLIRCLALVGVGLAALVFGADLLVDGARITAERFNVPKEVIGLTVVAIGTSIPELAFSVRAAQHQHGDLVLGNVLGSNVFNLLCVLGIAGLVDPIRVPAAAAARDVWIMMAVTVAAWILMIVRKGLSRFDGGLLLAIYALYTALVVQPNL